MLCKKKYVPKIFKILSGKYMYSSQESLILAFSCEFWKNFKNIYVVEHLWTHICVKWSNEKMFSHKYVHRKTLVRVSFKVQLYVWGLWVLLKRNSITDTFLKIFCRALVLQNSTYTSYYSATGSDFQQHFCVVFFSCFISSISIQSQLGV